MIDCFQFFDELDLLEIRLNSMAPYVERFVLCECPVTHSGNPKHLYFEENKDRFKDFNITHLIVDDYERLLGCSPWKMENYQRDYLINGIKDVDPDEIILISDLDEIPNMEIYNDSDEGVFIQKVYYYALNIYSYRKNWKGTVAVKRKNISTVNNIRFSRSSFDRIPGFGGWHFSTLGSADKVIHKIESFAHQELNTNDIKNKIEHNITNFIDPYGRGKLVLEMPSGPKWLLDNKERYRNLFYGEVGYGV